MDNTITMHILETTSDLICYHLDSFFPHVEVSGLNVVEEICAGHVF
jgi:hypothetical protein